MSSPGSTWTCPEGHQLSTDFNFCPHDGNPRPVEAPESAPQVSGQTSPQSPSESPPPPAGNWPPPSWQTPSAGSGPPPASPPSQAPWSSAPSDPWEVTPPGRPGRGPIILGVVAAVLLLLGGTAGVVAWALTRGSGSTSTTASVGSTPSSSSAGQTLMGGVTLYDPPTAAAGCLQGQGGYGDIGVGTAVELQDQTGQNLASSHLGQPQASSDGRSCLYQFTISNVPPASYYQLQIGGNGHRGKLSYTSGQLAAEGWHVHVTLGHPNGTTTTSGP